jgi:phosphoglycerate dehydrogenase-like enzyme
VPELRGSTLGIVGYGDIGRATARLAKAYGMKVLALTRRSRQSQSLDDDDILVNELIVNNERNDGLNRIFMESDYVLCALPLTPLTHHLIGAKQFSVAKQGCVFINVGRGPVVDEDALIAALRDSSDNERRLKGAALDVFTVEPLPASSPLWDMDNVLLSPHNMDQTATFLAESTAFFVQEQLPRFVRGLPLLNQVDPTAGY